MIDTQAIRKKLLDFAVKGKLTKQFLSDGTAEDLLELILIDVYEHTGKKKKSCNEDAPFTIPDNWVWTTLDNITYRIWAGRDKPADFSK